ncbi:hypothetical protein [Streptomyces bluensis]|uniref:hypothetical protein n=1 Tax=Streptomyces bluensis TaxID=33897 RepID=UPI00331918A0
MRITSTPGTGRTQPPGHGHHRQLGRQLREACRGGLRSEQDQRLAAVAEMGDIRRSHLTSYGADGVAADCVTYDQDLFHDAYVAELADFTDSVRTGRAPAVTGEDAAPPCRSPSPPSSRSRRAAPSAWTSSRTSDATSGPASGPPGNPGALQALNSM